MLDSFFLQSSNSESTRNDSERWFGIGQKIDEVRPVDGNGNHRRRLVWRIDKPDDVSLHISYCKVENRLN